ncbi:serine-rich adhesin for platelets [Diprion similis]|uniref:serine-rich adhesin for platelets n=1 Tax=Diprion similis TaxID=362088 RepID=UPI001EF98A06|nr:serine-rich adhesin for platelets [Diprion similis]
MKALTTGPSVYPGTTFSCRFLLWALFFMSFYSGTRVHGNADYRQSYESLRMLNDDQRTWENLSENFQSVNAHRENDKALESSRLQNDSAKLPLLLDENNIMHAEVSSNNDEENYSDEYEEELHHPSELKTTLRPANPKHRALDGVVSQSPTASSLNISSKESHGDEDYLAEYDAYYYYDEDENDTDLVHHLTNSSNIESDKIKMGANLQEPDYSISDNLTYHKLHQNNFSDNAEMDDDEGVSMESSNNHYVLASNSSSQLPDKSVLIEQAIVSVVTTKSVVNGTVSIPVTPLPQTTEQISSPPSSSEIVNTKQMDRSQTTENSIVLASVQTSRSISGARFLPFAVVEQVEQVAQNVNSNNKVPGPLESTESINDKLDRVQSELSSGIFNGGFRNSGNTLQLDVLPETEQAKKSRTTTMRVPVISKFVPHQYNANRKPAAPSRSPLKPTITRFNRNETKLNNSLISTPKSVVIKPPQLRPPTDKTSSNAGKEDAGKIKSIVVQDIAAFLPPGYNIEKVKNEPTEKSIIDDIFAKAKVNISSLLPPGYNNKQNNASDQKNQQSLANNVAKKSPVDLSSLLPSGYKPPKLTGEDGSNVTSESKQPQIDDLFAVSKVDLSSLLPPNYNLKKTDGSNAPSGKDTTVKNPPALANATTPASVSTTKTAGIKLVFPSRPGGRKPINRITTPSTVHAQGPGGFKPAIHKGWPVRATTEFTGWPTSSTTPISIEKLLEAARTATPDSNTSSTVAAGETSTTTTTTTTTTTPRPTTPGICEEECEVAGTIRLVGNTVWIPELLDSNTKEWKQLAAEVENEIDLAFTKSNTLRKWYKKIRIDAFSQGSILVDYFVELSEIGTKINTQELKTIFHDALNIHPSNNDNSSESDNLLVLGEFTIDPASTDFVVVQKRAFPPQMAEDNTIIPQWAIAIIVIGVGGLLFTIVFGVFVMINRRNVAKIKPTMPMFDEEIEKNIIHKNQTTPRRRSLDYPKDYSKDYPKEYHKDDLYDIDADWNDKSFDSTSNKMMVDGPYNDSSRYNLYDSWRSEWNGYYYNASRGSNRSPGYESTTGVSRHRPNYDTNF